MIARIILVVIALLALLVTPATKPARAQAPAAREPKIVFVQPAADDTHVNAERVPLTAKITDETGIAAVVLRLNGERVPGLPPPKEGATEVTVDTTITLAVGENVIGLTATNKAGRSAQAVRTITRTPPAVAAPRPAAPAAKGDWYAVVIGVGTYEDQTIPRLPFAENDARAMYTFLTTKAGYKKDNVVLITDTAPMTPTLVNIKRGFVDVSRKVRKPDTVFVYYAGYGAPEVDASGKETDGTAKYLIPRDADATSLFATAFSLENLEVLLSKLQSERVIFALDTSFSGQGRGRTFSRQATRSGVLSNEFVERVARGKGRVMIFASSPNEVALELPDAKRGLFTYYLLQGMEGAADSDRDGIVTLNELFGYVQSKVTERARQQNARQTPLMSTSGAVGDLPFVQVQK